MSDKFYNKISTGLFFIFLFTFIFGFIFFENAAGGGRIIDLNIQWNNHILLKGNFFSFLYNHQYYESHLPTYSFLVSKFFPFIENKFQFRNIYFFLSFVFLIIFYVILKKKLKKNYLVLLILNLIILSPYYRTSSFWASQENLSYIIFLLTFYLDQFNNFKFKKYLVLLFSLFCFYCDQKFFFVSVIYYFKYLDLKKIINKNNILISLFCFILLIPALVTFYYWQGPTPYWISNREAYITGRLGFDITGSLNSLQIISIYIVPFILILKKFNLIILIKNIIEDFRKKKLLYIAFPLFVFCLMLNFPPKYSQGGGALYKIYLTINQNFDIYLSYIFFSLGSLLSIIILSEFLNNFKNKKLIYLFIFYFLFLGLIITPLYQEYFDPLLTILIIFFIMKNSVNTLNFKNLIFLNIYFFLFLVSCFFYYN